jgi:hypothetical protein
MLEPENNTYMNKQDYNQDIDSADFVTEEVYGDGQSYFDGFVDDIDFSELKGQSFKTKLKKVCKIIAVKEKENNRQKKQPKKPDTQKAKRPEEQYTKEFGVRRRATLYAKEEGCYDDACKTTKRIIVPSTQKVIIEGVDNFILNKDDSGIKKIGYYKGKKLLELIITVSNISASDFLINIFDPSMPLDYLQSSGLNLNNKVQVAGGNVQYSDVLFNILGNPIHIPNVKLSVDAPTQLQIDQQTNQPFRFINKKATGQQQIEPLQLSLQIDNMQVAKDIVFFDLSPIGRPFIPNGMDVLQYNVLAGSTVTFNFFYRQRDLRKLFFEEARKSKNLL